MGFDESTGAAIVNISFCRLESGRLKVVAETFKEVESGGFDVTKSHNKRIDLVLRDCVGQLHKVNWTKAQGRPLVMRKLLERITYAQSVPKAKTFNYGTYRTLDQLLAGLPVDTTRMIIPGSQFGVGVPIKSETTGERLMNVFAFSDGNDLYIETQFYKAWKNDEGWFEKMPVVGQYMGWFGFYGEATREDLAAVGLDGVLVHEGDFNGIVLDTKNHLLIVLGEKTMAKILEPEPELLKEYEITRRIDTRTRLSFIKWFNELHPD